VSLVEGELAVFDGGCPRAAPMLLPCPPREEVSESDSGDLARLEGEVLNAGTPVPLPPTGENGRGVEDEMVDDDAGGWSELEGKVGGD